VNGKEQLDEISKETAKSYVEKKTEKIYAAKKMPSRAKAEKDLQSLSKAHARIVGNVPTSEETDTPGNSYAHQCALHVKHSKLGEGKTLFSQHAEPSEDGTIDWYDVMFEHGIERVETKDVEIVVSESHMNHKKKGK
jgi:hypothetical protein